MITITLCKSMVTLEITWRDLHVSVASVTVDGA